MYLRVCIREGNRAIVGVEIGSLWAGWMALAGVRRDVKESVMCERI